MDGMQEFEELMRNVGASEGIPVAKVKSLKGVVAALPWLAYFDEEDQWAFWTELYEALDEVHSRYRSDATVAQYAQGADVVLREWRTTSRAIGDGVLEVLENAEMGDFGEVEPPYRPKHPKLAIVYRRSNRYQILDIRGGHYLLHALFGSAEPDYVWWACKDADEHLKREWLPPGEAGFGLIEDVNQVVRPVTQEELRERGLTDDD